jgi:hypothetical protein
MFDSAHGEWRHFLRQRICASVRAEEFVLSNGFAARCGNANATPTAINLGGAAQFGLAAQEAAALSGAVTCFNSPAS